MDARCRDDVFDEPSGPDATLKAAGRRLPVQVHLGEHEQASGRGVAPER